MRARILTSGQLRNLSGSMMPSFENSVEGSNRIIGPATRSNAHSIASLYQGLVSLSFSAPMMRGL